MPNDYVYQCYLVGLGNNRADYHYCSNLGTWLEIQKGREKKDGDPSSAGSAPEKLVEGQLLGDSNGKLYSN